MNFLLKRLIGAACALLASLSSEAIVDADGDGLSDLWAARYPGVAGLAHIDSDGDGKINKDEALAGTDPFDPLSSLHFHHSRNADGTTQLWLNSVAGKAYSAEWSVDLHYWQPATGSWSENGGVRTFHGQIISPATISVFWRIVVADIDTDGDGATDAEEALAGTSPTVADTDRDGLPDGWELRHRLNPLAAELDSDPDQDGLSNVEELQLGLSPVDALRPLNPNEGQVAVHRPNTGSTR